MQPSYRVNESESESESHPLRLIDSSTHLLIGSSAQRPKDSETQNSEMI